MASTAVRLVTSAKKPSLHAIHIQLHVKPGAHKNREGITAVTETAVNLCVSAQAKEGEANKAVIDVLSDTLRMPKSRLQLARGLKSRDKTVVIDDVGCEGQARADSILETLRKAIGS